MPIQISEINNEPPAHKTIGIKPPKLNMEMSDQDYNKLCEAMDNGTLQEFVTKYKTENSLFTNDEVIALGLFKALNKKEITLLSDLEKPGQLLFTNLDQNIYPLIISDVHGDNAISYALKNFICISYISSYIGILKDKGEIANKFILGKELIKEIAIGIKNCSISIPPTSLIKDMIEPIYTSESVEELRKCIGVDWLETYYI
ncbi:hypothetical protein [Rickettsia endosymbiont of Halotydeus destructor]|uniref:hypothetical protein n=1 Tax=Rickettsia endosymbiont of Halotydeus destructor TaxID=2996754 RepID=UPI003BAEE354